MELNKDFREFIESLHEHDVKYLLIGGYAVNFHGYPRYTKDLDLWIWMTRPNIEKLLDAISDFGFGAVQLTVDDFMDQDQIVQLGYEPYRIDLLVDVEGVDFEKCYDRKSVAELDGIKVYFLSRQDLIIAKKKTGRLQDLADAEQLQKLENMKNE